MSSSLSYVKSYVCALSWISRRGPLLCPPWARFGITSGSGPTLARMACESSRLIKDVPAGKLRVQLEQSLAQVSKLQKENLDLQTRLKFARQLIDDDDGAGSTMSTASMVSAMDMEEYLKVPLWRHIRIRTPWLMFLLLLQSFSALIMGTFDDIFERHLVLALFITMIVGAGGNAGNQPGVMLTRALGKEREYIHRHLNTVLRTELILSLVQGSVLGLLAFCRVLVEYPSQPKSALVIGLATCAVVVAGIFWGIGFSLGIDRLKLDPAAGAAPLTTVLADTTGITLICVLALLILGTADSGIPKYCHKAAEFCPEEYFPCTRGL